MSLPSRAPSYLFANLSASSSLLRPSSGSSHVVCMFAPWVRSHLPSVMPGPSHALMPRSPIIFTARSAPRLPTIPISTRVVFPLSRHSAREYLAKVSLSPSVMLIPRAVRFSPSELM